MKQFLLTFVILIMAYDIPHAQDKSLYQKHRYIVSGDTLPYRLLLPVNYDPSKKYPLVLFLHGTGERGNDNEKQLTYGAALFLEDEVRAKYPAIIVFPQCPESSFWSNVDIRMEGGKRVFYFSGEGDPTIAMKLVQGLLQKIMRNYGVQKKRVYVGGLSMGGMGTFEIVRRQPKVFAAAFPICGGGAPSTAPDLTKISWWVFHGAKDEAVPSNLSEKMVNALKAVKAPVRFTLYPDVAHNSWDAAFAEPELLPWLFSQEK